MSRRLFTRIANDLAGLDPFFTQRPDARNYQGFTTLQNCTAAICEYDENAAWGNTVPVDPPQQDLNSFSLTNDFTHANLQQDLVEHI
ncbi:hypothetical protein Hanom_Chr16g01420311 [Helianthus anomalus]